jgi:nucleotide-binding universal stress UspA family protein
MAGREASVRSLRESLRTILARAPAAFGLQTSPDALPCHVSSGHRVQVILERARATHSDLIVMGPHRAHGALDFGSTLRGVLAHAPRGVWMQPVEPRIVRRILVPIDLSPDSLSALATARDLALSLGARLTVLKAFEPVSIPTGIPGNQLVSTANTLDQLASDDRAQFEYTMRSFDWRGAPHDGRFEEGAPAQCVLALEDQHDLVVMGTHGRTALSAVLLGAVAHKVMSSAHIPVLALRYPRSAYLL